MLGAHEHVRRQRCQGTKRDIRRQLQIVGDRDVDCRVVQAVEQVFLVRHLGTDPGLGISGDKGLQQLGHHDRCQGGEPAHVEFAPGQVTECCRGGVQSLRLFQKLFCFLEQFAPGRRQRQPLGVVTQEELRAEFGFQLGNGRRNRGLRDIGPARGVRDAAGLAGGDKVAELAQGQFHRCAPESATRCCEARGVARG